MIYDALSYAVIHCNLTPSEFYLLTPAEWTAIAEAQIHKEEREVQTTWEQTRGIMYVSILPHLAHETTAQEFFPLPWDKPREETPPEFPTAEELHDMEQRYS